MEAMTCGCPVLVARSSALPETCGDGAAYCNPSDTGDIANKISQVLGDPNYPNLLAKSDWPVLSNSQLGEASLSYGPNDAVYLNPPPFT